MIHAVIFDMDGIIIESESIQSKAYGEVIKSFGKDPVILEHGLYQPIGIRGDYVWEYLKKKYDINEDTEILREKRREIYLDILGDNIQPMPGLYALLKLLKEKQIKLAVATGSAPHIVNKILTTLHIREYFDVIVTGADVIKGKPDPECYRVTSDRLFVEPDQCVVLEDAESGIIAANAIGMKVIAVPTPWSKTHDLSKADIVVGSLENITWDVLSSL